MIITIDGPSGTGKSTVAREVAHRLSFAFLDTGALYRAIAYGLLTNGIALDDEQAIRSFLIENPLDIILEGPSVRYAIAGADATSHLRTPEVSQASSIISAVPIVRTYLLPVQRAFALNQNIVCEGRDMGTTVFPEAEIKIFLTASQSVRAHRRFLDLKETVTTTIDKVEQEIAERDLRDSTRAISPLVQPPDATLIDTSEMTIEQVVAQIVNMATTYPHWEHFAHQADIGIRGIGATPAQAFAQAAVALTAAITNPASVTPRNLISFSISAYDLDTLFFDFLSRIIYEMDTGHILFSRFDVAIDGTTLQASMYGEPIDPSKHVPAVEVKAATYYELLVHRRQNGSWCAQCVVDV
jgi:cytidylate kinase